MTIKPSFMAGDLADGWSLTLTEPGAWALPADIPESAERLRAIVPGTVAAALEAAGRFDRDAPEPLIGQDAWYRRALSDVIPGPAILRFEGLATIADVFLDDRLVLSSTSMFESHDIIVDLTGGETLSICFHALEPHLEKSGPRARWRPRLMNNQGLRLIRTTPLGFMPGWCPEIQPVGPWRPITLLRHDAPVFSLPEEATGRPKAMKGLSVSATLAPDGSGILKVSFDRDGPAGELSLACDGQETAFTSSDGRYSAELRLPGIKPWWPHTHGEPALHDVVLQSGDASFRLAPIGFRRVEIDRGTNGEDFAVLVNGEKIFCRGAVWTSADIAGLPGDRQSYEPWLQLAKDAGMNMIRVPGIAVYESSDFFALCDELGLMVWQDLMFANFDYPASDPDFVIHVKSEVGHFLETTQANASLAIVCGGNEIWQQAAMLGLPERIWKGPLCNEILPDLVSTHRPDMPFVGNSPSGGALPFYPNAGVAHYYGVGAYRRPLEDARRANIRFAAECLAFSNLATDETLAGGKIGIPRDAGADWDFEDIRDHYLGTLYDVDPQALRTNDFDRYLALSRAVTGEVMEATFAEWRRPGSSCNGALTFTLQDMMQGPGWGLIDADRRPKPAWFALRRAFRPVQAIFSDEGTNGLDIHLLNETTDDIPVTLEVTCLRDGKMPVVSGRRELSLSARSTDTFACTNLFGAFFDTNHAYRFGPPSHDVVVARLTDTRSGTILAEAFHFPLGRARAMHEAALAAALVEENGSWRLEIGTDAFLQSMVINAEGFIASDNWFHLAPGATKSVSLLPASGSVASGLRPQGTICSLGGDDMLRF